MSRRVRAGAAGLLLLAGAASACRFERRPDVDRADPAAVEDQPAAAAGVPPAADSVRALVAAVNDAFAMGDGARLAQLTTRDAVLLDAEAGVRWSHARGERVPPPLVGTPEGAGWTVEEAGVAVVAEGVALVTGRFTRPAEGAEPARAAWETWVAVRTGEGWRVRALHRSPGAVEGGPLP